jgi:beta-glucosidase-like glycosyl hydrolase
MSPENGPQQRSHVLRNTAAALAVIAVAYGAGRYIGDTEAGHVTTDQTVQHHRHHHRHDALPSWFESPSVAPTSPEPGLPTLSPAFPTESSTAVPTTAAVSTKQECIAALPRNLKVNQLLMLGATPDTLPAMRSLAIKYHVGGIILMKQATGPQVHAFQKGQEIPSLVSTDEEGGESKADPGYAVMRYYYPDLGPLPAASDIPGMDTSQLTAFKHLLSQYYSRMAKDGITMNLAPVADVAPLQGSSFLGSRIISKNPDEVARVDKIYLHQLNRAGILGTLKHYMGTATTGSANTDLGPATTAPLHKLGRQEKPYIELEGTNAAIMTNNATTPGLSDGTVNSLSRNVIKRIRGLGYEDNIIITDSLSAGAVTHLMPIPEAVVKALAVGNDTALDVSPPPGYGFEFLVQRVDILAKEAIRSGAWPRQRLNRSVERVLDQKQIDPCTLPQAH